MSRLRPGYGGQAGGQGRVAAAIAVASALALAAFGVVKGTWAVGGSDSSCYALMAAAFAHGAWQPTSPLAVQAPWPDASRTLAPGGFLPSPVRPDAASPVCAPGVSFLMSPLIKLGGPDGLFVLSPVAGAVLVWCAFLLARRMAGGMAGAMAAIVTATSPIVLFQVVQPMNDVVTAALWIAALATVTMKDASAGNFAYAGLLSGLAILVRPNLAPVALLALGIGLALSRTPALKGAVIFGVSATPPVALLLMSNRIFYGSPIGTGYGDPSSLFSSAFFITNATDFLRRVYETQTPFPLLALLAPLVLAERARLLAWSLLAAAAVVIAIYLFYRPYPEWWYLRFELLAVVLLLVVASAVAVNLAQRANMAGVIPLLAVVLAIVAVRVAGDRQVFMLQQLEGRYRETATLVHDRLPENAVVITVWQSGSVRFHAGREAVLWDSLDPAWLDRAVAWLADHGRVPYLLLERAEERDFRDRFRGASALGALDWPPRFDISRQARIYDPADRTRYLAGEAYATENTRPARQ